MNQENEDLSLNPSQSDFRKALSENLHGCDINNVRVLSYQNKAPAPPEVLSIVVYYYNKRPFVLFLQVMVCIINKLFIRVIKMR